jgi:hypothetical protein
VKALPALGAALVALLTLAGCTSYPLAPAPASVAPSSTPAPTPASSVRTELVSIPLSLRIPAISVDTGALSTVGLNTDGTMQVPPLADPLLAAYYKLGPVPGADGPALVVGHVNGSGKEGVFARLHSVVVGDTVALAEPGGSTKTYTVYKTAEYDKCVDATGKAKPASQCTYPWSTILAPVPGSELRLITCTGPLNTALHSYTDNYVVYAKLTA